MDGWTVRMIMGLMLIKARLFCCSLLFVGWKCPLLSCRAMCHCSSISISQLVKPISLLAQDVKAFMANVSGK